MARFAQIDAGVVTGTLITAVAPTDLPVGRTFVDITGQPTVQGGETYNAITKVFTPPAIIAQVASALDRMQDTIDAIALKVGVPPKV